MLSLAKKKLDKIFINANAGTPYPKNFKAKAVISTSFKEKDPYPNWRCSVIVPYVEARWYDNPDDFLAFDQMIEQDDYFEKNWLKRDYQFFFIGRKDVKKRSYMTRRLVAESMDKFTEYNQPRLTYIIAESHNQALPYRLVRDDVKPEDADIIDWDKQIKENDLGMTACQDADCRIMKKCRYSKYVFFCVTQ